MAPHSSTLAWKIPGTEEPGRLQAMGSLRVWHDWVTSLSLFTFMHWRRKWQPTPLFLPGESQGWGSMVAAVYGVAQSRTRLKRLSSSSSNILCWIFSSYPCYGPYAEELQSSKYFISLLMFFFSLPKALILSPAIPVITFLTTVWIFQFTV